MIRYVSIVTLALALPCVGVAGTQSPILDMITGKAVQKYAQSTCEQLWEQRGQPKTAQEQEFIQLLRGDPSLRAQFIDSVRKEVSGVQHRLHVYGGPCARGTPLTV